MRFVTLIAAVVVLLGILYLAWQLINSNRAGQSRRDLKKRKSDRIRLSRADRRAYKFAQKLYQEGNFRGCAKILESLGLVRESINILEKAGLVREAADTLVRIQRPNRAGFMLARHSMWKEAMECFKRANLPLEVGKCARELGDLPTAIPYFLEAGASLEAAECFLELGKHHEAARLFLKINETDRAVEQYVHLVDSHLDIERIEFTEDELLFITKKLIEDKVDSRLADILVVKKRSSRLIAELLKNNNLPSATTVYMRNTTDIGPELIANKEFKRDDALLLGTLFSNVGAYEYSGMVYERLEEFEKAGDAFEKGELFERAAYCFERAKNKQRATEMRIEAASRGPLKSRQAHSRGTPGPSLPQSPAGAQKTGNTFSIQDTEAEPRTPGAPVVITLDGHPDDIPKPTDAYLKKGRSEAPPVFPGEQRMPAVPDQRIPWEAFFQAEFLVDLTTPEQEMLQGICKTKEFPRGSVILDFDQEPLGIYFLLSGTLSAIKRAEEDREIEVDVIQPSASFGELWLLMDQPTRVKFIAKSNCHVGWIKRADFEYVMDKNGAIARKLYKRYAFKLVIKLINDQNQKKNRQAS